MKYYGDIFQLATLNVKIMVTSTAQERLTWTDRHAWSHVAAAICKRKGNGETKVFDKNIVFIRSAVMYSRGSRREEDQDTGERMK